MKLTLKNTKIVSLSKFPGEETTSQVLVVASHLTPQVANKLRCRDICFDDRGVPRRFDQFAPSLKISNAEVGLGDQTYSAKLIHKCKIARPASAAANDVSLELRLRLHFDGSLHLADWVEQINKGEFILSINAAQGDLDFGDGGAEESAVEPEEEELDTGCIACNNEIPMGMGGFHATGQKCTREDEAATLASAREAAGGTHQAKRRSAKVQ